MTKYQTHASLVESLEAEVSRLRAINAQLKGIIEAGIKPNNSLEQKPVSAIHLGWDRLDNGQLVATYFLPVAEMAAPKLYTTPQPALQPLTDDWIRGMCKESWVFDAAKQWIRIAEREACAKECDDLARLNRTSDTDSMWQWEECAASIRARNA